MNQGRIIVITGAPGTGKTTTASAVAKESDLEKSVHMHTDDFYHYLSKGAIPPHLPESNEQNLIVIEAFLEAAKRYGIIDLPLTDRLYRYKKEEQHGSGSSANKKRLLLHGAEFEIRRWQSQVQMDFNRDTGNWEEKCKVGGRNVSRNQMHL